MVSSDEISRRLEAKRKGIKVESRPEMTKRATEGEGKTCPSCRMVNPDTAKFCVGCGAKIDAPPTKEETPKQIKVTRRPDDFGNTGRPEIKPKPETTEAVTDETPDVMSVIEDPQETEAPEPPTPKSPESFKIKAPEPVMAPETHGAPTSKLDVDPVERIKKAKELLDIGAITQEEFDIIKKKYLDEI